MIPDEYHDFFLGAVTVAGALVGLLFVAISVHPGGVAGQSGVVLRVRAGAALSALLNALFISLIALLPGKALGAAAIAVGISGLVSAVTMLLAVVTRPRELGGWQRARMILLLLGQCAGYVVEIVNGVHLRAHPGSESDVNTQAVLVIIFFALAVERTWEYVGGQRTGIWGVVDEARHAIHRTDAAGDPPTPDR
jgi:hypothetical protein